MQIPLAFLIQGSGYGIDADQTDCGLDPSHDAYGEFNMAAAALLARKGLNCLLFKILLQRRGLTYTTNLYSAGSSKLLFSRPLCYASRNLYPEDQGRKIMVAGLKVGNDETDRESLEHFFKSYGPVERVKVVRDQLTGRSKGYGFVTFKNSKAVEKVMSVANHVIDGRGVRLSLAVKPVSRPGEFPVQKDVYSEDVEERKIFVSTLKTGAQGTTERDLQVYFSGYGEVEEAKIVAPKSYGFVTFKDPESVKEVLSKPLHSIAGWNINVERPFQAKEKSEIARKGRRSINVYNVTTDTSNDELVGHFSSFGEVETVLGRGSDSKPSSQCMVVFKTEIAAKMALEQPLQELDSKGKLYVKPMSERNTSKTILLRKTPVGITLEALQLYFEQFGEITRMDLTSDHHRSTHANIHGVLYCTRPGLPTIEFRDEWTVERVLQNEHVISGAVVEIRKVDRRALNSDVYSQESDRSMMVLIDNLPCNVTKKTVVDYFTSQSLMVQSVEFRMERAETMSCVVGFWNLDDVDQVISNKVAAKNGVIIGGETVYIRRLHWENTQEEIEHDAPVEEKFSGNE